MLKNISYRYIDSVNRQGLTYRLGINHFADRSDAELKFLRGKQKKTVKQNNGKPFDMKQFEGKSLPDSFDWRIYGAVTPGNNFFKLLISYSFTYHLFSPI